MQDFVSRWSSSRWNDSRWIDAVVLVALTSVVAGIFLPAFPWSSFLFMSMTASLVLWLRQRTAARSTAQVIWDVEAEGAKLGDAPRRSPRIPRL